jgi:hypothetical protein
MVASEDPKAIKAEMQAVGEETRRMMVKVPMVREYRLIDTDVQHNAALACMWTRTEVDSGQSLRVIDGWVCPLGNRTLKLTTSYRKSKAILFEATVNHIWRSLSAKN